MHYCFSKRSVWGVSKPPGGPRVLSKCAGMALTSCKMDDWIGKTRLRKRKTLNSQCINQIGICEKGNSCTSATKCTRHAAGTIQRYHYQMLGAPSLNYGRPNTNNDVPAVTATFSLSSIINETGGERTAPPSCNSQSGLPVSASSA